MAKALRPSEFGGHTQRNTLPPPVTPRGTPGHEPTSNDKLRLLYMTGQTEDSTIRPFPEPFEGLDTLEEAKARMPKPKKFFDQ